MLFLVLGGMIVLFNSVASSVFYYVCFFLYINVCWFELFRLFLVCLGGCVCVLMPLACYLAVCFYLVGLDC